MNKVSEIVLQECKSRTKSNPLTRKELRDITKLSDASSRNIIGGLRDMGYRIINDSQGYWYANAEEYKAWLPTYEAYAKTIYSRISAMNKYTEGQIEIG